MYYKTCILLLSHYMIITYPEYWQSDPSHLDLIQITLNLETIILPQRLISTQYDKKSILYTKNTSLNKPRAILKHLDSQPIQRLFISYFDKQFDVLRIVIKLLVSNLTKLYEYFSPRSVNTYHN